MRLGRGLKNSVSSSAATAVKMVNLLLGGWVTVWRSLPRAAWSHLEAADRTIATILTVFLKLNLAGLKRKRFRENAGRW